MNKTYQLKLDNSVEVEVSYKDVKHIYLRINSVTAKVYMVVPKKVNEQIIRNFLLSKKGWIEKHQTKITNRKKLQPKEYIAGESHYFFGNLYTLKIIETNKKSVIFIEEGDLVLQIKPNTNREKRQQLIEKWYRNALNKEISSLIMKWEEPMQVKVLSFGIKKMKTKWGTCNIKTQKIWLNLELIKRPYHCLEYVVVHEMVHLLERNHSAKFHAYMTHFLPHWKQSKERLNQITIEE